MLFIKIYRIQEKSSSYEEIYTIECTVSGKKKETIIKISNLKLEKQIRNKHGKINKNQNRNQ